MSYAIALVVAVLIASGFGVLITWAGAGTAAGNALTIAMLVTIVFVVRCVLRKS